MAPKEKDPAKSCKTKIGMCVTLSPVVLPRSGAGFDPPAIGNVTKKSQQQIIGRCIRTKFICYKFIGDKFIGDKFIGDKFICDKCICDKFTSTKFI